MFRQDHEAITDVLIRYARAVDTRDWDLFRTCFTADVVADYGDLGWWNNIETLKSFMIEAHMGMGPTQHRLTNFHIELDGKSANAVTYVHAVTVLASGPDDWFDTVGTYEDHLVCQSGSWQIARRTFRTTRVIASPSLRQGPPSS